MNAKNRNIWDNPGTNSPVAFVNPAFLDSQTSMDSEYSQSTAVGLHRRHSRAGMDTSQAEDFKNDWEKVMNKALEGLGPNNRVNNALAIPR